MRNKEHGREKGIDETSINVKNKQPKKSKRMKLESGFDSKNIYAIMLISKRLIRRIPIQNKI